MRKIEIVTGFVVVTILCLSYLHFRTDVAAQTASETDVMELKRQIQSFFTTLEAQPGSSDAYPCQSAFKSLPIGPQTQEVDIQAMAKQTEDLIKIKEGNRWRPEFLDHKPVGSDLIQLRYLYKSESNLVVWYFTFYRSQTGMRSGEPFSISPSGTPKWICIGVRFDNDFDTLFNHSSRISP